MNNSLVPRFRTPHSAFLCGFLLFNFLLVACVGAAPAQARPTPADEAIERTRRVVAEVIAASYPELRRADVRVRTFDSDTDYFRTSFSLVRCMFGLKMRYVVLVNPKVFERGAPEEGVRAIVAHELGHVYDFARKKRIRLFGLVRLASQGYAARFERRTDLQAILRGYGDGLKAYRAWLYRNVPPGKLAGKRRNYFSPEEIDAMMAALAARPELGAYWLKRVPRRLAEIVAAGDAK